jgi:predicted ATP-grasp superfamily ATP-dependent carboligase
VVAGAFQTGVVLMRNLARRGLTVYCIDCNLEQPGFRTVYGKAFGCPNPDEAPAEWLGFMTGLARKIGGKPVLIPSADQFVSAIAQHGAELEKSFVFCHAAAAVQGLLATKQRQYDLAGEHGLPVPQTRFVSSLEELAEFASSARFPCLLKPLHVREWEKVPPGHPLYNAKLVLADSREELIAKYRLVAEVKSEAVVQEIIEGPDTAKLVYLACYGRGGERIGACMVRQLRTTPIYFGSASAVEPVSDPEADALCDRFLRGIGYAGLCEIEVKRDTRDGKVKMIEANPRYSVTADAAPYAGVDLGWLHYLDLIGQPVETAAWHGRGFRHIVLFRDFATIRSYRQARLWTWADLLRSYRPPVAFFDFDLRDWRVTAATLGRLARLVIGPPLRKLFPKG